MSMPQAPGRWVEGGAGGSRAFVPAPLPPAIEWSQALVAASAEAHLLLGRLAGEGSRLPNPHVFIRPFVRREAVLSSKIEGTQATLGELLAVEAGAAVARSPEDLREVANYVVALEYGIRRLKKLPLSLRLVRELHAKLMRGVRGDSAAPGEFRRVQNWIGPARSTILTAAYVPPPPDELLPCLGAWELFLHDRRLPPLIQIALAHYQFEAIHPFVDGNGRVGRLLISLYLIERGILPSPLLYLSAYFERTRPEYYALLRGVSDRGEWGSWLEYFLEGVARMSEDVIRRVERINALLGAWQRRLAGAPRAARLLVPQLAENPYVTATSAAKRLGVAFTTAQRAIGVLERQGMVRQVAGAKRDRVYCSRPLLAILEEPAELAAKQPHPASRNPR
jgi:Fic family protein